MQSRTIDGVLRNVIMPMADRLPKLPSVTTFMFTEHDSLCSALTDVVQRDCPVFFSNKETLLQAVAAAYDEVTSDRCEDC